MPGNRHRGSAEILDEDHFGLEKIKRRILEHLAVRKLNPEGKSPILCFVGPPGVGKTSLGQSIARATGRKFQRVALGGMHDEAEIRGHRRTYIGALPGSIIQAMNRAGSRSRVLMLDEIDKLGAGGFHGDPSSALLEVLDPEQNSKFRDNYLGVDFDLSKVMFIATANVLDTIPGPLRDRMEIIQLPGYTEEEKLQIARNYLVKRQLEANGLRPRPARFERRGRCGESSPATPARRACAPSSARSAPFCAMPRCASPKAISAKIFIEAKDLHAILGAAEVRERNRAQRFGARCRHRPRLDAGGRRHPVHRGVQGPGHRQADPHRPARRRDEGVRAGRPHRSKGFIDGPLKSRHPYPRSGRRDAQGRPERRRRDVLEPDFLVYRKTDQGRRRHDRRNLAARAGDADRRA